jgi:hypothetical protein
MPNITALSHTSIYPIWRSGTFNGSWGLREYDLLTDFFDGEDGNGMMEYKIGNISGNYKKIVRNLYIIKGIFYPSDNRSQISNITGICYGNILIGNIEYINIDNDPYNFEFDESNYVGFGDFNETSFNWRLMLKIGPTFYIRGNFN